MGGFLDGKPSEKAQFNDLALARVECGKAGQGAIKGEQIQAGCLRQGRRIFQDQ